LKIEKNDFLPFERRKEKKGREKKHPFLG